MALKQQSQTKRPAPGLETQGPSMGESVSAPLRDGVLPPNPSDAIFSGKALPVIPPQDMTRRREFTIPTRPTLHYRDGLDGAAETVTVNERRLTGKDGKDIDYIEGPQDLKYPPRQGIDQDFDHGCFGTDEGVDANKYSEGPNDAYTTNGQWIRGT